MFFQKDYIVRFKIRNIFIYLTVIFLFQFVLFSGFASAAICGTPGRDGAGASGVVNTYYPGNASVSAGATSIPVGSSSGSATPIAAGDLLLIIQMQDADINYTNTSSYGSGLGSGTGYTALNSSGLYEFAVASGPVSAGSVSVYEGLINSYRYRAASSTNGQSAYQVIRVPQYSSATASGVSALAWNGSVGGVAVIDVAGTLTISGSGAINVNGAGFRGGYGRGLAGGTGAYTDYRTLYTNAANGSKGEGIAGTPYYMNRPATFDGAPVQVTGGSGYPDGSTTNASYGRGSPGNAGGGSTDGNPTANDQNSGGGGGGNYAVGGNGGNSWSTNRVCGGLGGSAVSGIGGSNCGRVVMGGGGGAGTTNNSTADGATYTNPAGIACSSAAACSSGAPGGGIVILRANSISNSGTITANGGNAYNVLNDGGGGGGGAGSVVIYSMTGGSATVYANGGNGGNAWRSHTTTGDRHGPGGGGSGGYIAYNPAGLGMTSYVTGGVCGKTCSADPYGATDGPAGLATSYPSNPPGAPSGAQCMLAPNLSTSTKSVVDINGGQVLAGEMLQYTITITETAGHAATVSVSDTLDINLDRTNANVTITTNPGCTYSNPVLSCAALSVPANGSVNIVYTVPILGAAAPGTTINNSATITPTLGWVTTAVAPVVTVAGTSSGTGNKPLYLYNGTSTPAWKISRTPNTTSASYATVSFTVPTTQTWSMNPVAASAITISSAISATVPVTLYLRRNTTTGNRNVKVDLQCSSGGTTLTQTRTLNLNGTVTAYAFALPLAGTLTCGQGNYWNLTVSQTSGTDSTLVYPQSGGNPSHVDLPATTVINVNSIGYYSDAYPVGSALTSVPVSSTVYIRAVVSDPFGSYDIVNAPTITIKNSSGTTVVAAAAMTYKATGTETPSLTKTYEYSYAVPASPIGNWSVSVTATEGTEGTVTNTAYATMPVVTPAPAVSPSSKRRTCHRLRRGLS